jgi:hypothetical protein
MKYQIELIRNIDLNLVLSRTEAKKDPHDPMTGPNGIPAGASCRLPVENS